MTDQLGSSDGLDQKKVLFMVYVVGIFGYMLLASIGASSSVKSSIMFYVVWTGMCFGIPFIIDQLSPTSKFIDTVSWEDPKSLPDGEKPWQNYIFQIFVGIILAGFTFWRAYTYQKAWINAPQFNIFSTPIGNGLLSGLAIAENWVFFGFIFPTLFVNIRKQTGFWKAVLIAMVITAVLFTMAHKMWIYRYNEVALTSTFLFAAVNCLFIVIFRSVTVSDFLHFSNNFVIGAGVAQKIGFSLMV